MTAAHELSVTIPAFNEEAAIADVVVGHDAAARALGVPYEIVVLDDGSGDRTRAVLDELSRTCGSLRVIAHERNEGIGRTILDLYRSASGRWIYLVAGDGQVPPTELPKVWLAREGCALVVGWRRPRRDPPHRVLIGRLYALAIRALFGVRIHDVDSVKLYDAAALRRAWPRTTSAFAEAEILVTLAGHGERIREVPICHSPRRSGRPRGAHWSVMLGAAFDLLRFLVRYRLGRW